MPPIVKILLLAAQMFVVIYMIATNRHDYAQSICLAYILAVVSIKDIKCE